MSQSTNTALVITGLADAGAETCLTHLACGLNRQFFQPHVYSLTAPPSAKRAKLVDRLSAADIPTHFLGIRSFFELTTAVRRLRELFRADAIEIVHSFLFHANVISEIARQQANVGYHIAGVRVAQRSWWRRVLLKRVAARVDRFNCVSESVREEIVASRIAQRRHTFVVPNGVILPESLGLLSAPADTLEKPFILAVARLDHQKGIDLLLEAADGILNQLSQHELWIAGDGPDRLKLMRRANRCQNHHRIRFLGWQSNLARFLEQAALFVLTSRWEGMPNVLLEAMAYARAVVCTDVEGVVEVLGTLSEQQVVPNMDVNAIIERTVNLATDPQKCERLGQLNRKRIADQFSVTMMIDRYTQLFAEVLSS